MSIHLYPFPQTTTLQNRQKTLRLSLLDGCIVSGNGSFVVGGITLASISAAKLLDSLIVDISKGLASTLGRDTLALVVQAVGVHVSRGASQCSRMPLPRNKNQGKRTRT